MATPSPFTCTVSAEPPANVCVLTLSGKLDALAAEEFDARVEELRKAGHTKYVLDLTNLEYVGSLGLRIFVALHNEVHGKGGVAVCGLSPNVKSVFTVTRLDRLLRMYPTRADAIDALRTQ